VAAFSIHVAYLYTFVLYFTNCILLHELLVHNKKLLTDFEHKI